MCADIYAETIKKLALAGVASPRLEARLLIGYVLSINPNKVCAQIKLSSDQKALLDTLVQKRIAGMPTDKILGHKEFYKYDFITSKDVLSPRPDTEILLITALDLIYQNGLTDVLDLGVGSGCILLSILKEINNIQGIGVDISPKALNIAEQNASRLKVRNNCRFINKSWFDEDFAASLKMRFDLIVSNPPYIKTEEIKGLDIEVRDYDPFVALDGGPDGLKDYTRIAEILPEILKDGGYVVLEVGINQASDVKEIFEKQGLKYVQTVLDLSGIERVVAFQK